MPDTDGSSRFWTDVTVFCTIFLFLYFLSGVVTGPDPTSILVALAVSLLLATTAISALRSSALKDVAGQYVPEYEGYEQFSSDITVFCAVLLVVFATSGFALGTNPTLIATAVAVGSSLLVSGLAVYARRTIGSG